MAVAATLLTNAVSSTDGTGFTTSSVSVTAGDLVLVGVSADDVAAPTLSGLGATWVQVATTTSITPRRIALFRAEIPSTTSGAITITFGSTATFCAWTVVQVTGQEPGNNGADAIEAFDTAASAAAVTTTLDLTGASAGATFGFATHQTTNSISAVSPAVDLHTSASFSSPTGRYGAVWDDAGGSTLEMSSSGSREWASVGARVIEASGGPPPSGPTVMVHLSGTFVEKPLLLRQDGTFA